MAELLDYAEIFRLRGGLYDAAMQAFPHARHNEFARLFDVVPVEPGQRLLDIPAGGGYLARWLGPAVDVTSLELTGGFGHGIDVVRASADWPERPFDHVVCLAALHHIHDRGCFLRRLADHARPGGVVHIADVAEGSPLCEFLDGFVGRYNRTGHRGVYLPTASSEYARLGTLLRLEEVDCPWEFADLPSLLAFCSGLFGLQDCPEDALARAIERVGVSSYPGGVRLHWRLLYADIAR